MEPWQQVYDAALDVAGRVGRVGMSDIVLCSSAFETGYSTGTPTRKKYFPHFECESTEDLLFLFVVLFAYIFLMALLEFNYREKQSMFMQKAVKYCVSLLNVVFT